MRFGLPLLAAGALLLVQCRPDADIRAVRVATGLSAPVFATAPVGDPRLFIVERDGRIRILAANGALLSQPFLDVSALTNAGGESGLLGLAFAPDYAASGLLYVNYTDLSGDTVIARYRVSANPDAADPNGEILLLIDQPASNHNGGHLAFGPDGMLFVGMGDGGGNPGNRAQDPTTLLGKMLRIDVSGGFGSGYGIPPNNPFASPSDGVRDEIWALGLRNPYRFSIDPYAALLLIGDVGQGRLEELDADFLPDGGGNNYGWQLKEGTLCFDPPQNCDDGTLVDPVYEYTHSGGRCAIVDGATYYGSNPDIFARHFFADFCTGEVWSAVIRVDGTVAALRNRTVELTPDVGTIDLVSGFGTSGDGELFIVDLDGDVFEIVSAAP